MAWVLIVSGAVAALRLTELWISRRRLSHDIAQGMAAPIREPAYAAMVAVHMAWLVGCVLEPWFWPKPFEVRMALPALLLWGVALGLRLWLMLALGRLWNVRLVERTAQPVVTEGPYAYVRHPNYLAVALELAAVPCLLGAYWTALLGSAANGVVLWLRIRGEERYLFSVPGYAEAFSAKKRLIPGLF